MKVNSNVMVGVGVLLGALLAVGVLYSPMLAKSMQNAEEHKSHDDPQSVEYMSNLVATVTARSWLSNLFGMGSSAEDEHEIPADTPISLPEPAGEEAEDAPGANGGGAVTGEDEEEDQGAEGGAGVGQSGRPIEADDPRRPTPEAEEADPADAAVAEDVAEETGDREPAGAASDEPLLPPTLTKKVRSSAVGAAVPLSVRKDAQGRVDCRVTDEVKKYTLRKIQNAKLELSPYPHVFLDKVFPPEWYHACLMRAIPSNDTKITKAVYNNPRDRGKAVGKLTSA